MPWDNQPVKGLVSQKDLCKKPEVFFGSKVIPQNGRVQADGEQQYDTSAARTVPSFPEWQRNEGKVRKADGEDAFGREKFCFTKGKLSRQYMPTDPAALHQ